jgi:hypothetical protein
METAPAAAILWRHGYWPVHMPSVSFAVAWQREGGPRLVGSAQLDTDGVLLIGRHVGGTAGEARLHLRAERIEHVELRRASALPTVASEYDGRPIAIELLVGGWGAAHDLADALVRAAADGAAPQRTCTVAIAARIEPGRRADLERLLAGGLPPELVEDGLHADEVSLGDDDLVLVLTGPERIARGLVRTGLAGLGGTVSSPRLLTQMFSWRRGPHVAAAI